jgi:transposase
MARFDLTDFEWSVIQSLLPNKPRGALTDYAAARRRTSAKNPPTPITSSGSPRAKR